MCDTMVATSDVTDDGITIFAKNSDREPNEAHFLQIIPAADHAPGESVRCTYLEIPQTAHTFRILVAKPFWIWGAEMGANEHGLTIGNEAVFTRIPYQKDGGLTGMDLLRLALERARTAYEGVQVITQLLEQYGQGGNCGFTHGFYYHNSFILADPRDAWVLETAGKHWAAEQVKGVRTISNGLTIESRWDMASADLINYAVERGWCKRREDFSFRGCYSDFLFTTFSDCASRQCRTTDILNARAKNISLETVMRTLRDHGVLERAPAQGLAGACVCMHAGFGPVRANQTTGSMVSYLDADNPLHFVTGTAAPCTSIFKPVWLDAGLPDIGPEPNDTYDERTLFWRHERLHRATLLDYPARIEMYRHERDALEATFVEDAFVRHGAPADQRLAYSEQCFQQALQAEHSWTERVINALPVSENGLLYHTAWRRFNQQAKVIDRFSRA